MIEIRNENKSGVLIIQPEGRLDGLTSRKFMNETEVLLKPDVNKVILDLERLDYISSEGLRSILTTAKTIKNHNGKFGICSPQEGVKEVLEISGFGALLGIYDSLDLAIASI